MKGIVFDILSEMVEERYGLAAWDALLEQTGCDGHYVATASYPDSELFALVEAATEATGMAQRDLVAAFGRFMLDKFYQRYPEFFDAHQDTFTFLKSVDEVVHVEVRKLFPDAGVPEFAHEEIREGEENGRTLTMFYRSPRKLCVLAEGLIRGSGDHFGEALELQHTECMHDGAERCRLVITRAPAQAAALQAP